MAHEPSPRPPRPRLRTGRPAPVGGMSGRREVYAGRIVKLGLEEATLLFAADGARVYALDAPPRGR